MRQAWPRAVTRTPRPCPAPSCWQEIEFVDTSIGDIVNALKDAGIYNNTLIIITAKHGESPIDPTRYVANGTNTPATLLGTPSPTRSRR